MAQFNSIVSAKVQADITPKAALDIVSNTSGLLTPRITLAQRDAIFNETTQSGSLVFTYSLGLVVPTSNRPTWGIVPDQEGMELYIVDDTDGDGRGYQLKWDNSATKWIWSAKTN